MLMIIITKRKAYILLTKDTTAILTIIEGCKMAFERFLVPVHYWKTVEKSETGTQFL